MSSEWEADLAADIRKAGYDWLKTPTVYEQCYEYLARTYGPISAGAPMHTCEKTLNCYEIFAVYAENPASPVVFRPKGQYAFGFDEEEAKMSSGIYMVLAAAKKEPLSDPIDPRFITIVCLRICGITKFRSDT